MVKLKVQQRHLAVYLAQFGLTFLVETCAAADEVVVIFLNHAILLVVETHLGAMVVHIFNLFDKHWVHRNVVAVG